MKKFLSILLILGILCGCDMADDGGDVVKSESADMTKDDNAAVENNSNNTAESNFVISQDKLKVCPAADKTAWVIETAQAMFAKVGMAEKRIDEIKSPYKEAVLLNLYKQINNRAKKFEAIRLEKYNDISCSITIDGIKKGDVILSQTHGAILMAADNENALHHASLCIKTPESDDDLAFISILDQTEQVKLISIEQFRKDNMAVVLRCESADDKQIETLTDYALKQIGKNYNSNFIDKLTEESFYCSQLVWAAYQAAGIQIDFNHEEISDYGVVLASDIYKSPNLKLIKYSY